MVINADQPKRVISRKIIDTAGEFSLELVEFMTQDGQAWGCRVFSEFQSSITDLFDDQSEAVAIGQVGLSKVAQEE